MTTSDALVRLVDRLEDEADSYVTRQAVEAALAQLDSAGQRGADVESVRARARLEVDAAIAETVLLSDVRQRVDGTRVTLCRLNRHHPLVVRLTSW